MKMFKKRQIWLPLCSHGYSKLTFIIEILSSSSQMNNPVLIRIRQ